MSYDKVDGWWPSRGATKASAATSRKYAVRTPDTSPKRFETVRKSVFDPLETSPKRFEPSTKTVVSDVSSETSLKRVMTSIQMAVVTSPAYPTMSKKLVIPKPTALPSTNAANGSMLSTRQPQPIERLPSQLRDSGFLRYLNISGEYL